MAAHWSRRCCSHASASPAASNHAYTALEQNHCLWCPSLHWLRPRLIERWAQNPCYNSAGGPCSSTKHRWGLSWGRGSPEQGVQVHHACLVHCRTTPEQAPLLCSMTQPATETSHPSSAVLDCICSVAHLPKLGGIGLKLGAREPLSWACSTTDGPKHQQRPGGAWLTLSVGVTAYPAEPGTPLAVNYIRGQSKSNTSSWVILFDCQALTCTSMAENHVGCGRSRASRLGSPVQLQGTDLHSLGCELGLVGVPGDLAGLHILRAHQCLQHQETFQQKQRDVLLAGPTPGAVFRCCACQREWAGFIESWDAQEDRSAGME